MKIKVQRSDGATFDSIALASLSVDADESTIRKALDTDRLAKGFKWTTIEQEEKEDAKLSPLLQQLNDTFTESELRAILKSGLIRPNRIEKHTIGFDGEHIRIGAMTDTHIGSTKFNPDHLFSAYEEFQKQKCDIIVHAGDIVEGMSHRDGHIYEVTHLGYDAQKEYAIQLMSQVSIPQYVQQGNHDNWFIKSNGAIVCKDIADRIPNMTYLGMHESNIDIGHGVSVRLWHGEDGNSYALSYRLQKIIESIYGGEKPNVMICGHTHKYVSVFERNIYAISAGSIQQQTLWMRMKKIAAHTGFCIVDIWFSNGEVHKLSHTWHPFYK